MPAIWAHSTSWQPHSLSLKENKDQVPWIIQIKVIGCHHLALYCFV